MPRNIDSNVDTEIVKNSVQPFHIAKIEFALQTAFVSEGPEVSFENTDYLADSLEVGAISFDESGFKDAQISLLDYNGSSVVIALQNRIADVPCTLWLVYRDSTGQFTTPVLLGKGTLEPVSINEHEVKMKLVTVNSASRFYPDVYCNKDNGFDHLIKNGTVIEWGEEKFELVN